MSYIVPIGPYHPALEEPIHAKLYTEGEVIKDAEVFVGYNHRGIEKLATERNAIQTLALVERVCGICSHSHALTYAMCVENIFETGGVGAMHCHPHTQISYVVSGRFRFTIGDETRLYI